MLSLLSFSISFLGILLLISMKVREVHYGKEGVLRRMSERFDPHILEGLQRVEVWAFRMLRVAYRSVSGVVRHAGRFCLEKIEAWTLRLVAFSVEKFRGKQSKKRRSPSFFLKDVSEHKRRVRL